MKNILTHIFSVLFLIIISVHCYSQQSIKFSNLSTKEGLSSDRIRCIKQDKLGLLWIATANGLNCYDGYKFSVFKNDPKDSRSISNNVTWTIYVDKSGTLWIGTFGGGLNKYDHATGKFSVFKNNPKDKNSISNDNIFSIYEDSFGNLWIGTKGGGLNKYDRKTNKFTVFQNDSKDPKSLSNNNIITISEDRVGFLWIGTDGGGLNKFNPKTNKFEIFKNDINNPNSISSNIVTTILIDDSSTMWFGTDGGGLNKFDNNTGKFSVFKNNPNDEKSLSSNSVYSIFKDEIGTLWIGTSNGLNKFIRNASNFIVYKNDKLDSKSLSDNLIWSIFEDNSGTMWFGSNGGLNKFDSKSNKFKVYQNNPKDPKSLSNNSVWSICEDSFESIWIGTLDGGLNKLNQKTNEFTIYRNVINDSKSLSDNTVWSIFEDKSGVIWIGTKNGLNKYDRKTDSFKVYKNNPKDSQSISNYSIYTIYEDKKEVLWIGTLGGGLNKFNKETGKVTVYKNNPSDTNSLSDNNIYSIFEDKAENLWIATKVGLNKFDRKTNKFTVYKNNPNDSISISDNFVWTIYEDKSGSLWAGTKIGLNKIIKQSELTKSKQNKVIFEHYFESNGFPDNNICGILEDNSGNLWVSTKKGISKFNIKNSKVIRNYDNYDGIPNIEFIGRSFCKSKRNLMFFGNIDGLVSFYPDSIKDNPFKSPVIITSFQIFNKAVNIYNFDTSEINFQSQSNIRKQEIENNSKIIRINDSYYLPQSIVCTKEITLSYSDYVFSFEFASLHLSQPERNKYAYILEGFDKEWNYIGTRRFATYTNLPAGEYTFKVKGTNNDGIWNEKETSLKIIVTPPWWETWWFRISCIVLLITSIVLYIKWRERKLKLEKVILEEKVQLRTSQLLQANEEISAQRDEIISQRDLVTEQKLHIEEIHKEVTDSINYATRLQAAILPDPDIIKNIVSEHFVLFKPKDKVSGDFYWWAVIENQLIITVADCTGHGVPGAFMSMLGSSLLREIVVKEYITNPSIILKRLRKEIIHALKQKGAPGEQKDGMDMALISINLETLEMQFSGANNPLYHLKSCTDQKCENQIEEYKADLMPVAIYENMNPFTNREILLKKGDCIYMKSDGFQDQFGGPKRRKFLSKNLRELIKSISHLPMIEQKQTLEKTFENWKGEDEQIDDVTILGVKI